MVWQCINFGVFPAAVDAASCGVVSLHVVADPADLRGTNVLVYKKNRAVGG